MALPRLFPGSIHPPDPDERSSEAAGGGSKRIEIQVLTVNCSVCEDRVEHTRKSAWIAGRGFGRLRVIMEDAFYGWIVWDSE
jgi:hypothetical protein